MTMHSLQVATVIQAARQNTRGNENEGVNTPDPAERMKITSFIVYSKYPLTDDIAEDE